MVSTITEMQMTGQGFCSLIYPVISLIFNIRVEQMEENNFALVV